MFIHVFYAITSSKEEEIIGSRVVLNLSYYIKERKNDILLFEVCDKTDRIWKLRGCFISKVTKHNDYCDYWMGGVLQLMFSEVLLTHQLKYNRPKY